MKVRLALRIWTRFLRIRLMVRREPLPLFVRRLGTPPRRRPQRLSNALLSRAVHRSLRIGSRRPTCLVSSLVLFRLLREQGDDATLVIGLPPEAATKDAHAWVELNGIDVGPPPGRGRHEPIARYA